MVFTAKRPKQRINRQASRQKKRQHDEHRCHKIKYSALLMATDSIVKGCYEGDDWHDIRCGKSLLEINLHIQYLEEKEKE